MAKIGYAFLFFQNQLIYHQFNLIYLFYPYLVEKLLKKFSIIKFISIKYLN